MTLSWLPYAAVGVIALGTVWHFARTRKHYAPTIATRILLAHEVSIAGLAVLASNVPFSMLSLTGLLVFLAGSLTSWTVAKQDADSRTVEPGTHTYRVRDGVAAFVFVAAAIAAANVFK